MSSFDRKRAEKLARAVRQLRIREERKKQQNPRGGLMEFIRYFWHVLEPVDPFVEGWPLECMCAHLEAITAKQHILIGSNQRQFNRLLANVPPGFMKSLCTNVLWPAWEWGPMGLPHLRYVAFSYSPELTQRDNAKFRDLITSESYRELWGHVFSVVGDGKIRVTNDKTGFKFATSIGGVGTGERGHRILCFPYGEIVNTEAGPVEIGDLVERRAKCRVWSAAPDGTPELRHVSGWFTNPPSRLVRVILSDGSSIRCTPNHQLMTEDGWMAAGGLRPGSRLRAIRANVTCDSGVEATSLDAVDGVDADVVPLRNVDRAIRRGIDVLHDNRREPVALLRHVGLETPVGGILPRRASLDLTNDGRRDAELPSNGAKAAFGLSNRRSLIGREFGLRAALFGTEGAVTLGVGDVLGARAVFEIPQAGVASVSVLVPNLLTSRHWPEECSSDKRVTERIFGLPCDAESHTRVAAVGRPSHDLAGDGQGVGTFDVAGPVLIDGVPLGAVGCAGEASDASPVGDVIKTFGAHNGSPDFVTVVDVVDGGHAEKTFCIEVDTNHNFSVGMACIQAKNCDDIHKIKQSESDEAREATTNWVREAMQNRLNDLERDAIVVIMQRVHEADSSGIIAKHLADEYCHLMIPMEFEHGRHFSHYHGWNHGLDPRTKEGELAWEDRYPARVLGSFKRNAYLWAGQYQQSPTPRGGGLFKDDWWQVHEVRRKDGIISFYPEVKPIFVLASLDTAFSEKESADYSALSIWVVYEDPVTKFRKILLADAWQKRLPELSGEQVERKPGESEAAWRRRAQPKWGLVEWVDYSCRRRRANLLIVENKNRAPDAIRTLKKHFGDRDYGVRAVNIQGDKWARAIAHVDLFTDNMVYAPAEISESGEVLFLEHAAEMMRVTSPFPNGQHDDLVDSMTLAFKFLKDNGLAVRKDEARADLEAAMTHKPQKPVLYPV